MLQYALFILLLGKNFLVGETTKEPLIDPFTFPDPTVPMEPAQDTNFASQFFYMLLMLGMLITMVMLASWFLKRIVNARIEQVNANSPIKILEKRSLSTKTTLLMIDVDGQTILLAESPTGVVQLSLNEEKKLG